LPPDEKKYTINERLIILIFGLSALDVSSQTQNVIVKFCPLDLADVNMPTVQAGVEFKLFKT